CIGVAGYPEKHPESPSFEKDIEMLKYKVDMGASFIITQLFFDNEYFYRFRERAEKAGINVPIVAGIMPIVNFSQIERFKVMCSSHIPENLIKSMEGKSEEDIASIGIDYAVKQCEDLVKNQVAGLHFYTLNRSMATKRILDNLHFLP
ncbi:MAG: methylenetetrahydrofolate reductase, partial [Candidatus Mucispirillum faecigallinarum]|nr:methylenetetrahydrofolate reductase [Candidatus Mucispirillum faecigallinarum]